MIWYNIVFILGLSKFLPKSEIVTDTWGYFINVLRAAFGHTDPESSKKTDNLIFIFAFLSITFRQKLLSKSSKSMALVD